MVYEDIRIFEGIAKEQGADIVYPIYSDEIVMDFKATYKCRTCPRFGTKPTCQPNIPEFDYFNRLVQSYKYGLLIGKSYQYENSDQYDKIRAESSPRLQDILLMLEKQAFQRNYYWAVGFIGGSCRGCNNCPKDGKVCATPSRGRIPMEAIGIDVIKTCSLKGIKIPAFPHPVENGHLYRIGLILLE